ncbi:MAG: hypothetical protein K2O14_12415 [Oscillospiraceae bacterium]|nr:hypothetical protein [Oscillospiraceae bacterium]
MSVLEEEIEKIEQSIRDGEADAAVMYESIEKVKNAGYGLEAVEGLLKLLEKYLAVWFGDPGEIVHFIEQFTPDHERLLLESVKRNPSYTTVFMMNRCINAGKKEYVDVLKDVADRTDIHEYVREQTRNFIDFQANK